MRYPTESQAHHALQNQLILLQKFYCEAILKSKRELIKYASWLIVPACLITFFLAVHSNLFSECLTISVGMYRCCEEMYRHCIEMYRPCVDVFVAANAKP